MKEIIILLTFYWQITLFNLFNYMFLNCLFWPHRYDNTFELFKNTQPSRKRKLGATSKIIKLIQLFFFHMLRDSVKLNSKSDHKKSSNQKLDIQLSRNGIHSPEPIFLSIHSNLWQSNFNQGTTLLILKTSHITPIFKSDDQGAPENYRRPSI